MALQDVDELGSLGWDGRTWVDVDALVGSFRGRAAALDLAGDAEGDPLESAVLHGRAAELVGRADALAVALLDELVVAPDR